MVQQELKLSTETKNLSITQYYQTPDMNLSELGIYTQRIPVYETDDAFGKGQVAFNLWIMDSRGGYDCYGNTQGKSCVSKEAVDWFKQQID